MLKFAYLTNSRWRAAAILKIENLQYLRYRSTDRDEILQEHAILNRAESENLHISEIQNGGRPPYWKSENRDISATVQPIVIKFCINRPIFTVNRA